MSAVQMSEAAARSILNGYQIQRDETFVWDMPCFTNADLEAIAAVLDAFPRLAPEYVDLRTDVEIGAVKK